MLFHSEWLLVFCHRVCSMSTQEALSPLPSLPVVASRTIDCPPTLFVPRLSLSFTFECHLCNSELASLKMFLAVFFNSSALLVLDAPLMRSSTHKLFSISFTTSGYFGLRLRKCSFMTPASKKGEGPRLQLLCFAGLSTSGIARHRVHVL